MVSSLPGSLPKAHEDAVRKVFKTLKATNYEDPVDQDAFLTDSAATVLKFRPQSTSFVLVPELGECIFTLRSMMHSNNARLETPPSDTFLAIQDFAGEIVRKRHLFNDRKRARVDRVQAAKGAASRTEREAALEHAANIGNKSPHSDLEDVVSIPSESESDPPLPIPQNPPVSPIAVDLSDVPPSSKAVLLSPLNELGYHLSRMSMSPFPSLPPPSPSSPNLSLPDLVPDFTLGKHRLPEKGGGWMKTRATCNQTRHHMPVPVVQSNILRLVRHPFGPPPLPPKRAFVEDWLLSKPKFVGSSAPRKNYAGNFRPSGNLNRVNPQFPRKKAKRCYHCTAADHLVALCPLREPID
ncbi:hypothetical protein B0H19DRAFT_1377778 [Mycena capillaripes]|nr:hypothetical protein B0H19DRAFT_1377778 [Mycena capillaripes]